MEWLKRWWKRAPAARNLSEARAFAARGDLEAAVERFDAHVREHPDDVQAYAELARALVALQREDEAAEFVFDLDESSPVVCVAKGEAYAALEEPERALELLGRAREWYGRELSSNFGASYARDGYNEVSRLYDAIYAEVHGHENVAVEHARRGRLDGGAGVNYALLGDSLMVDSPHRAEVLHLESPADARRRLAELPPEEQKGARGLLLRGSIALREGRTREAEVAFESATALDGTHFGAFRGLGAAKTLRRAGWPRNLAGLVAPAVNEGADAATWSRLASVAPDLPALTEIERKIVLCSIAPLRHALPALASAGAAIRVMPLDARTTDYPEFASDHRFADDHRALSALSGVAGAGLALVRLDQVLDAGAEHGWVFGHEFAHLAHRALSPAPRSEVAALYARAAESGYAVGSYALKNVHEFFAVLYEEYLGRCYQMSRPGGPDELGVVAGMMSLFDRLAGDAVAFGAAEPRLERARDP